MRKEKKIGERMNKILKLTALEKPNIAHLKEYTAIASKFLSLDNY